MSDELVQLVCSEQPEAADAIVWLQVDQLDRGQKVLALYRGGYAPRIFIIGNNVQTGTGSKPGEIDVPVSDLASWLVESGVPETVIFTDTHALNTREEAVRTTAVARERGWKRILLVTSPYHQPRAFLTFQKAVNTAGISLDIVNQPATDLSWDAVPSGRTKTARECWEDEKRKIAAYGSDVAAVDDGIAYLRRKTKGVQ